VIAGCEGKVAVTAFASNVARIESAIKSAEACGRTVCLVGRSMHRIVAAAKSVGLLADAPDLVDEDEAGTLPDENVLYLCTGSQGEARAALSRIARGDHRNVVLHAGDTVIFSSRVIPGNEAAIHTLYNQFIERGVELITADDEMVHVSGHPGRDELKQMYEWARPQIAVPVHGERRHLLEHVKFALSLQVPEALAPSNGDLIRLAPGPPAIIDEVPAGRLFVDGNVIVAAEDEALRDRRRLAEEGAVTVTLAIGERKNALLAGPNVSVRGLAAADEEAMDSALDDLEAAAKSAFSKLSTADREDDDLVEAALVRAVRKAAERAWGKRPLVDVSVLRI
jgi:ribonuclease J